MKRSAQPRARRVLAGRRGVASAAAGAAIVAAAVATAGASALAAPQMTRGNYHGPARQAQPAVMTRDSNDKGPVRRPAAVVRVHGSNLPSAVLHHDDARKGTEK